MLRPGGAVGVGRPDRSVSMRFEPQGVPRGELKDLERAAELAEELEEIVARMPPGSFTQDPGMRAGDEFTDVGSAGYREGAERVAERGGAKEYATSVEEGEAEARADTLRNRVGMALAALSGLRGATARPVPPSPFANPRNAGMATPQLDRLRDIGIGQGRGPAAWEARGRLGQPEMRYRPPASPGGSMAEWKNMIRGKAGGPPGPPTPNAIRNQQVANRFQPEINANADIDRLIELIAKYGGTR